MSMRDQQEKKGGGLMMIISKEQQDIVLNPVKIFTNYERKSEKFQRYDHTSIPISHKK